MNTKKHFRLVTAEILFRFPDPDKDSEFLISNTRVNAIFKTDENIVTIKNIGQAQQLAQMHFRKKMPQAEVEVLDVIILGLSYMGYMTDATFSEGFEEPSTKLSQPKTLLESEEKADE